jgi:hypothetical protein
MAHLRPPFRVVLEDPFSLPLIHASSRPSPKGCRARTDRVGSSARESLHFAGALEPEFLIKAQPVLQAMSVIAPIQRAIH